MSDLEFRAWRPDSRDLDDIHARDLVGPTLTNSTQGLRQLDHCANELRLDAAVLNVPDPASNPSSSAAVLNVGSEADALNDALEANSNRVVVGHDFVLERGGLSTLHRGFT